MLNTISHSEERYKQRQRRKLKPYMNETGPGDYNMPQFTGNKSVLAEKKTGPSFSFGTRAKKVQFISKEYLRVRAVLK